MMKQKIQKNLNISKDVIKNKFQNNQIIILNQRMRNMILKINIQNNHKINVLQISVENLLYGDIQILKNNSKYKKNSVFLIFN